MKSMIIAPLVKWALGGIRARMVRAGHYVICGTRSSPTPRADELARRRAQQHARSIRHIAQQCSYYAWHFTPEPIASRTM
ncbi:hypothetical protein VTO73DRAFT_2816 [Trametes versicolor]